MSHADLLPLIDIIYQAGMEPDQWPVVLARLIDRFHGTATLFIQDQTTHDAGFLGSAGIDPKFMRDYDAYFASINPAQYWWPILAEGTIIDFAAMMGEDTFVRTEFYNDFFRAMDVHHAIGTIIQKDEQFGTHLSLQRPIRDGDYSERERDHFLTLGRHIRRSIEISRRLTAAGWAREATSSPVKSAASGFIFVDSESRVLLADDVAETILQADNGLTVSNGRLRTATSDGTARLRAMVQAAASTASGNGPHSGNAIGLPRRRLVGPPLAVLVCPWHGNPVAFGIPGPAVLIFVEDPCLSPKSGAAGAAMLYNLTPAETRVLEAILNGQRLSDHAAAAEVSIATARTHLSAIFAKTGQRRQADLVRLILSSGIARWAGR
jgi:DNA-binding CsgD family transcriptional regulator